MGAIKEWQFHDDFVLRTMCKMILNRDLLKIQMVDDKPNKENLLAIRNKYISLAGISEKEAERQELIVHVHFDAKYKILLCEIKGKVSLPSVLIIGPKFSGMP